MIISFFGHSSYLNNTTDEELLLYLLEKVAQSKPVNFYLGGYGGFNSFALKCVRKYKQLHPTTKLIFVTPYLGKWLNERKDFLEKTYDEILYPPLERVPAKFAILKRNEWMVNQADYIFAYVTTHYGGAYKALLYAHKHRKSYINLYQGDYELY